MPPIAHTIVLLVVAYLLGSVSGSLVLGRARGVDIREHGSGNAGGTNAFRTLGWKFALAWCRSTSPRARWRRGSRCGWRRWDSRSASAGTVMRRRRWRWSGMSGRSGTASAAARLRPLAAGGLLVLWPWLLAPALLAWLLVLLSTGYVGLATVVAALTVPLWAWWTHAAPERMAFAIALPLLVVFTHRSNLLRLWRGEESRFQRARLLHRLYRGGQG